MSKKKGLKRGSEEWKRQQLDRYMKAVGNKDMNVDNDEKDNIIKEMELLKAVKARMDARNSE